MLSNHQLLNEKSLVIPVGEHLFDEAVQLTGVTEYGISWQEFVSGQVTPPPEGARFDIAFAGSLEGSKLNGSITGVDFLEVRADGRFLLHIHATITTDDGERIALYEDGLLIPSADGTGIAQLRLNMQFTTSSPKYAWVNQLQVWGRGSVDMAKGEVSVKAYVA
jgi:hypothetical protein